MIYHVMTRTWGGGGQTEKIRNYSLFGFNLPALLAEVGGLGVGAGVCVLGGALRDGAMVMLLLLPLLLLEATVGSFSALEVPLTDPSFSFLEPFSIVALMVT